MIIIMGTERQTYRQTDRDRDRETETETQRHRERQRDRETETERQRQIDASNRYCTFDVDSEDES